MFSRKSPQVSINKGVPKWLMPVVFVVILAVVVGGLIYYTDPFGSSIIEDFEHGEEATPSVATGEYQAVFLDNGQVYFGKITSDVTDQFVNLENVYYIQATAATEEQAGGTNLIKLGNETHGPEDKMSVNRDHILMIENLKGDSKIVQAIQDYQTN
jgi:hypothetical protein